MRLLVDKLGISVDHLRCLDDVFMDNSEDYRNQEEKMVEALGDNLTGIAREIYAGGKKTGGSISLNRQMILGDIVEYIFSGRAYYYAAKSSENYEQFIKLIFYSVNQLLLFDTITVNPQLRREYIEKLQETIDPSQLYEKEDDQALAEELMDSDVVIWTPEWKKFDSFVDSILPKTLGCPKELIVFVELIRLNRGLIVPLLLIQRLFGDGKKIAPPDFLLLKRNKEVFGIEVGYAKEGQSREFSLRTSIPTFAVDLANHMHNRCPKCGENILYCDTIIETYADGSLWGELDDKKRFICDDSCPNFEDGFCKFANYYGKYEGGCFNGEQKEGDDKKFMHYHAKCVSEEKYIFRGAERIIGEHHMNEFFSQYPVIEGIESI